jgi:hypothetical protein
MPGYSLLLNCLSGHHTLQSHVAALDNDVDGICARNDLSGRRHTAALIRYRCFFMP